MKKLLYFIGIFLLSSYSGILDSLADTEVSLDTGDTAWIMTATALVLFMTLPGLALFYGGLVNSKNVLSALMHFIALAFIGLSHKILALCVQTLLNKLYQGKTMQYVLLCLDERKS